jgi:hypothetical protein
MGVVQSFAGLPNVSREAAKKQKAEKADSFDKTSQASQNMKRQGVLISVEGKGVSGNARAKRNNDPPRSLAAAA